MGGAMDLVAGTKRVVVVMEHANKAGESKVLSECKLPLTGKKCVNLIITDLAVFEVTPSGMILMEHAPDVTVEEIQAKTEGTFAISPDLKPIAL